MIEYKTKKTAQTAFNREICKMASLMCPVFKTGCITKKCASFGGRVYLLKRHLKPDVWKVFTPCCTNAIVTGSIEMEMP